MMRLRTVMLWAGLMPGLWRPACPVALGYESSVVPVMNGAAADFAERRAGKEVSASIRVGIREEGVYRLSYGMLTNAGVPPSSLVGSDMRLFCRTQEVAISVSRDELWTSGDFLLFVGNGYDGYYSPTNVYWLGFGAGGKRMASRGAGPVPGRVPVTTSRAMALRHIDYYFKDNYRWNDTSLDHWVDRVMSYNAFETNFVMVTDGVVTGMEARLDAVMLGRGEVSHTTRIRINGTTVAQAGYEGEVTAVLSTNFPATSLLVTNIVRMQQLAGTSDLAYLERLSITYGRSLAQTNRSLFFEGMAGSNTYQAGSFPTNGPFTVLDVTDPAAPVLLTGSQVTNLASVGYGVLFGDITARTSRYAVCDSGGIRDVPSVQRVAFRDLASGSRSSDYVIICPYEFREEVYRLLALRHSQGLSVAVAPLPDLYNEFSYGIADAAAIKQFIGYAFHHWKSPPKYILLAGGGSYNPRYLDEPHSPLLPDWIPVHLGPGNGLWVSLDGWYAAVNGPDAIPDVALGRLPVVSAQELKAVTDKMMAFEGMGTNLWVRNEMLMVCDTNSPGYDFDKAASDLVAARVDTNTIYVSYVRGTNSTPRTDIKGYINGGMYLVNFFGHGDSFQWSGRPMLLTNDVSQLANSHYPVVCMMTCLNGAFQGSKDRCMAAWFLTVTNRGASACVAASGLASLNAAEPFMNSLYGAVLGERKRRAGDALLPAYSALATSLGVQSGELQFFGLLSDPAMIVNP